MVIRVEQLDAHYGDRQILNDINLHVSRGEIHVIMGSSGSGKSTLLRHILGLQIPSSGSIHLLDQAIHQIDRKQLYSLRKKIGVAFQGGALLGSLTVEENIELPLREHTKLDANTIRIMARMKLEMMNLAGTEHMMPAELSGGMLKRAGLARAVVMDPQILLFDEPSAGLDPVNSAELDELIIKLRDAMNMTILVITHELQSAFAIADRITIIDEGKLLITGSKEEIHRSQDEDVLNLLQRRVGRDDLESQSYLDRLTHT